MCDDESGVVADSPGLTLDADLSATIIEIIFWRQILLTVPMIVTRLFQPLEMSFTGEVLLD